ncbi:MAG: methyltransferase [Desulfobacterales bacterium]|jgi:16S rRNA G1207 methylase RsmC
MMFSLESFHKEYETDTAEVVVNGEKFKLLTPKYLFGFINTNDVFHDFPLWAKIWQASWVLADHLAQRSVEPDKEYLEIGAGIGFVSIVGTTFGHRITLTEHNPDALQFACANAHINNCSHLPVFDLDWNQLNLKGQFDYIVGSEITYQREELKSLLELFKTYLKPTGKIILAAEMRKTSAELYDKFRTTFNINVHKKILRSNSKEKRVYLFYMTFKRASK